MCEIVLMPTCFKYHILIFFMHCCLLTVSVCLVRYATMSGRRLPPVTQAVPKLPAVNEGGIIVDDIAKGDSGSVAIQQLYEDMRSDWTNYQPQQKSTKNLLDRTIPHVCCLFVYISKFVHYYICILMLTTV